MTEKEPTILVQAEFIEHIDSIDQGLDDIRSELEVIKGQQEESLAGIEQYLDDQGKRFEAFENRLGRAEHKIDGIVAMMGAIVDVLAEMNSANRERVG